MRNLRSAFLGTIATASFSIVGLAQNMNPANLPAALHPPAGQVLLLGVTGKGVQIYACTGDGTQAKPFAWALQGPEAELLDSGGHVVGKHYAGPTWESTDGSSVVGEVKARDDGPDTGSIPWLLLSAKSTSGTGLFSKVLSIQRLETSGGKAPSAACNAASAGQTVRVPYSAQYNFFGPQP